DIDVTSTRDIAMSPEPSIEPSKEPSKREARQRKAATRPHRLPDDWVVTEALRGWATEKGFDARTIEHETEKFVTYWQGCGKAKSNWDQAWRNWMLNALDRFQVSRFGSSGGLARAGVAEFALPDPRD